MSSRVHLLRFVRDDASKTKPTTVRCRWVYYVVGVVRESSRGEISLVDTQIRSFPNDSKTFSFARTKHAFARFSSKCREKSPVPPPPTVVVVRDDDDDSVVVVVVSSRGKVQQKRAPHQKSFKVVPLCFEVFLLFPPMFFPPSRKKKEKKRGVKFRVSNGHTKKGLSL